MVKKLSIVIFFAFFAAVVVSGYRVKATPSQDTQAEFKDNNCVSCHAKLSAPYKLTSRYAEWQISSHKEKAVGCEKCHGGDPGIKDEKKGACWNVTAARCQ